MNKKIINSIEELKKTLIESDYTFPVSDAAIDKAISEIKNADMPSNTIPFDNIIEMTGDDKKVVGFYRNLKNLSPETENKLEKYRKQIKEKDHE